MKKKILLLLIALTVVVTATLPASAESGIAVDVYLDGSPIKWERGHPVIVGGLTYVPIKSFSILMGDRDLVWDQASRSARLRGAGLDITAQDSLPYITVNDRIFYTGGRVFITDGTMYVPVRSLAKAYGIEVKWSIQGGRGRVDLISGGSRAEPAENVYDSDVLYWLSRIISAESRGESLVGQIAVGNVVLNRTRSSQFPNSVYGVIFDTKFGVQFTPISNGTIYNTPTESAVIAAKICLEGYSLSNNIYYFINRSTASSQWVHNNRPYAMTIGSHSFYS